MHAILGGWTRAFLILFTGTLTLTIGCGGTPASDGPAPEPESTAAETSGPIRLDMDKIFPPGPGRVSGSRFGGVFFFFFLLFFRGDVDFIAIL